MAEQGRLHAPLQMSRTSYTNSSIAVATESDLTQSSRHKPDTNPVNLVSPYSSAIHKDSLYIIILAQGVFSREDGKEGGLKLSKDRVQPYPSAREVTLQTVTLSVNKVATHSITGPCDILLNETLNRALLSRVENVKILHHGTDATKPCSVTGASPTSSYQNWLRAWYHDSPGNRLYSYVVRETRSRNLVALNSIGVAKRNGRSFEGCI